MSSEHANGAWNFIDCPWDCVSCDLQTRRNPSGGKLDRDDSPGVAEGSEAAEADPYLLQVDLVKDDDSDVLVLSGSLWHFGGFLQRGICNPKVTIGLIWMMTGGTPMTGSEKTPWHLLATQNGSIIP